LEIGGASAQIAFEPRGSILANKFPVLIAGKRYPLYVHSYLDYGLNTISDRVMQLLKKRVIRSLVHNPCMQRGKP